MNYLNQQKNTPISFKKLILKGGLFTLILTINFVSNAQLMFSESFDEVTGSVNGVDNIGAVNWTTACPTCLDGGDFFKVNTGELVAQDSNGPATWETSSIDISSSTFFNISFVLKEEGNMEACATGCTSVDWVQLEYNIDNTGWQTPTNSVFCSGGCAGINVIQSDDINGTSLNYSTDCIESGANLEIRISVQAWAASERWIIDNIEVSTATGPIIDAGLDQTICSNSSVTLTASNPQNGILTWNNSVLDGIPFTPPLGSSVYVASTELNGCTATDTVVVNTNTPPTFNLLGTNPTTCNGTDGYITISGLNSNTTYDISYATASTTVGPNALTSDINGELIISNLNSDNYTDFLVDLLGCSTLNNSSINLSDPAAPSLSAGTDQTVCIGESVTLTAINTDNATITWNNGITDGITFTATLGITNYTATANLNGCTATSQVTVTANPIPQVNTAADFTVCEGELITLVASNINSAVITWDNGIQDGIAFIPPIGLTNYTATANLNGCSTSSSTNVTVTTNPTFTVLGSDPTTCNGTDGEIILSGLNATTDYTTSYTNGTITIGPNILTTDINGDLLITNLSTNNYSDFLIDLLGCSTLNTSILNLINPLVPTISAGTDQTVCLGENVTLTAINPDNALLTWDNGVTDNLAFTPTLGTTTYTVTADLNSCTATSQVNVNVNTTPTFSLTSTNPTSCNATDGTITLSNLNPMTTYDLTYTTNSGFIGPTTLVSDLNGDIIISNLSANTYTNFSIDLAGCSTLNPTLIDLVNPTVPIISAGPTQTVCEGENVTLTAINTSLATISWDNGVQDGVSFIPTVGTTTYTVTADLSGCIATSQMDVIVNPNPTFTLSPSNPTSCLGTGSITISGLNTSTTYNISYTNGTIQGPFNLTSDLTGQLILQGLESGDYSNFLIDESGCTTQDNATISLTDPLPPIVNAGQDQHICFGDNVTLTAINPTGSTITWNNGIIDGLSFQPTTDMVYITTATLNNCTNTDTVSVFVITDGTINAGPDQTLCYGESTLLHATNTNGIDFVWSNNVTDSSAFMPETTTIYTVTSSVGSCAGSDDVKITVHPLPDASFTFNPNNPTVENTEVVFNIEYSNPTVETYTWNFGDSETSNLESPHHLFPIHGGITYDVSLLVTDTAGCKDSSSTRITIDDILVYYVPNAFTPDGDHINNIFKPVFTFGFDPQDYHLTLFNRWGEIVFESYNAEIGWNGRYHDQEILQQGVYVWMIQFGEIVSDKTYSVKGTVTLIK